MVENCERTSAWSCPSGMRARLTSCWRARGPGQKARSCSRLERTDRSRTATNSVLGGRSSGHRGAWPAIAQDREQVKLVFEHALPNVEGKRMAAVLVSYPPGSK